MYDADDFLLPTRRSNQKLSGEVVLRAMRLVSGVVASCCAVLTTASFYSEEYPILLSYAFVAFTLGFRHAMDSGHLAAIDNVTRQLLLRGQRPVSVGFWFAMGHSTVVIVITAVLAGGYTWASQLSRGDHTVAGEISVAASVFSIVLLAGIGVLNTHVAVGLYSDWSRLQSESHEAQDMEVNEVREDALRATLSIIPFVQRVFRHVDRPFKMYGVGFLFGLSFDSATQVALIGLAAISGTSGHMPPAYTMIFPIAFSCGMCLVDTVNGLLMLSTYTFTLARPVQQLFYNFLVTSMSAGITLVICSLELLPIIVREADLHGAFWDAVQKVDMVSTGYSVIVFFTMVLLVAACAASGIARMCVAGSNSDSCASV